MGNQRKLEARRTRVLELYSHDISIRQITEHINADRVKNGEKALKFQTIHQDLQKALAAEAVYTSLKRKQHVQLILKKIQRIEAAHIGKLLKATSADEFEKYTRGFQRLWDRFDSITDVRTPVKLKVDARQTLAKLTGRSPEEFPDGDSDS